MNDILQYLCSGGIPNEHHCVDVMLFYVEHVMITDQTEYNKSRFLNLILATSCLNYNRNGYLNQKFI